MNDFVEDRSVLSRPAPPPDAVVRYGELDDTIADVRSGATAAVDRPLVILIHGGFWRPEFDRKHTGPMSAAIAAGGWTVASIEYRRVPGKPDAMLEDVGQAIANLPALVENHNGKAIVMGHSAGGHLALWSAVRCASPNFVGAVVGVLALAPVADLQAAHDGGIGNHAVQAFLGGPPDVRSDVDPVRMPSPEIDIALVHGQDDAIAPIALSEHYVARHPRARLIRVERCGHFAVIDPASAAWSHVIAALKVFS